MYVLLYLLLFIYVSILQYKDTKVHKNISTRPDNKEPNPKEVRFLSNTTQYIF